MKNEKRTTETLMLRRLGRLTLWLLALSWLAGCVVFAAYLPPVPRSGWQPPEDELALGFAGDSCWLVTRNSASITRWNTETGDHEGLGCIASDLRFWLRTPNRSILKAQEKFPEAIEIREHIPPLLFVIEAMSGKLLWSTEVTPKDFTSWLTCDELDHYLACQEFAMNDYRIKVHDLKSGTLLHSFGGCRGPLLFSPDGSLFVACEGIGNSERTQARLFVFEMKSGDKIAQLPPKDRCVPNKEAHPLHISRDNTKLLDTSGDVYDLRAQQLLFSTQGRGWNGFFTSDSRFLVKAIGGADGTRIIWYDAETGHELADRSLTIDRTPADIALLSIDSDTPQIMKVFIRPTWKKPFSDTLFDRFPWIWDYWPGTRATREEVTETLLVNVSDNTVLLRAKNANVVVHPSGLFAAVTYRQPVKCVIYSLPPDQPWLKAAGITLLGLAPLFILVCFSRRKRVPTPTS